MKKSYSYRTNNINYSFLLKKIKMETRDIIQSVLETKDSFDSTAKIIRDYLEKELGMNLREHRGLHGRYCWEIMKIPNKRVFMDLYVDGKIIFDLQNKVNLENQTSLDTSEDFSDPYMDPAYQPHYIDSAIPGELERLVEKIKQHLTLVSV